MTRKNTKKVGKHSKDKEIEFLKKYSGSGKDDFYLGVYNYIKEREKLPSEEVCGLSKQRVHYYVKSLKSRGLIEPNGYALWKTTDLDYHKKEVKKNNANQGNSSTSRKNIRAHSFQFTLKLGNISNWDRRLEFVKKKKIPHHVVYGSNPAIKVGGFIVHLNNNSLVFYAEDGTSYYAETAKSGRIAAINDCIHVIRKIEQMLGVSFVVRKKYQLIVSQQEYGQVENELAKNYNKYKDKLAVYGEDGKKWLLIDNSFNLNELETVHPITAQKDMDECIVPFFNSLKDKKGFTADFIMESFNSTSTNMNDLKGIVEGVLRAQVQSSNSLNDAISKISEVVVNTVGSVHDLSKQHEVLIKEVGVLTKTMQYFVNREIAKDSPDKKDPLPYVG